MKPAPVHAARLVLRPWRSHEAHLYLAGRDELVIANTIESGDLDLETCESNIAGALWGDDTVMFAICLDGDRPVGSISARRFSGHAELSYWLMKEARGRGLATEALVACTEWVESNWPVGSVELEILTTNHASIRVAEGAGFRIRGHKIGSACGGPSLVFFRETGGAEPTRRP